MRAGLSPAAERLVRLGERLLRADVVPASRNAPAVDGRARVEPLDEPTWLVRVVPFGQVFGHELERRARIEVERNAGERAARLVGLLLQPRDAVVGIELDHGVAPDRVQVADVVDAQR